MCPGGKDSVVGVNLALNYRTELKDQKIAADVQFAISIGQRRGDDTLRKEREERNSLYGITLLGHREEEMMRVQIENLNENGETYQSTFPLVNEFATQGGKCHIMSL